MNIGGNGNKALGAHESSHGYDVWKGGYPTTGDGLYATEVKAYGRQYSLSGSSSMPKSAWGGVGRLGDVNNQYVGGIKDSGGVYMYARQAWSYKYNVYTWNNKRYDSLFKQLKKNR